MKEKILSIIVPVYNVENFLEQCICSLLDQELQNDDYEIIIINDASTDSSLQIANRLAAENSLIRIINCETNGGLSAARNKGLEVAEGKYILYVDSDDYIAPNSIKKIIDVAEKYQAELCFFLTYMVSINEKTIGNLPILQLYKVYSGEEAILNGLEISSVWHNLYLHSFLDKTCIKFHEGILHEDIEYNMKLYPQAKRIIQTDIPVYNYRRYGNSILRPKDSEKLKENFISNLIIAVNILNFIKSQPLSTKLRNHYEHKMNSILVSQFITLLIKKKKWGKKYAFDYLKYAKDNGAYPIKNRTESIKSTLLIPFINIDWLYTLLLKA